MGYFGNGFEKIKGTPATCKSAEDCPRGYDKNLGLDIEGMPFIHGDPRVCPIYGHICPEVMGDFGLTEQELGVRGMVHRLNMIFSLVDTGILDKGSPKYRDLLESYEDMIASKERAGNS